MNELNEKLLEELDNTISFVIPVFGGIPVPESVLVTWGIMAILLIFCLIFVRDLKVRPTGKRQIALEAFVNFIYKMFTGIIGEKGRVYVPYLGTVLIYLAFANLTALFGFPPPTKDLNVTAALAIMSIVLINYATIREKTPKGWLHHFTQPIAIVTPINILELLIRPLSLCMRLFGNILGSFIIMELIKIIVPVFVPAVLSIYFDIFDGLIQAYVFVFLTSLFIREGIE